MYNKTDGGYPLLWPVASSTISTNSVVATMANNGVPVMRMLNTPGSNTVPVYVYGYNVDYFALAYSVRASGLVLGGTTLVLFNGGAPIGYLYNSQYALGSTVTLSPVYNISHYFNDGSALTVQYLSTSQTVNISGTVYSGNVVIGYLPSI